MHRLLYILGFFIITAFGCTASKKKSSSEETKVYQENSVRKKAKYYNLAFDWMKGKMIVSGSDVPVDVSVSFRIKKDSVIWLSASVAAFPVAKLVFTKDTAILIDIFNKRYFAGDYKTINDSLKTNLSYKLLQSALLGDFYAMYHDSLYTSYSEENTVLYCTPKIDLIKTAMQNQGFTNLNKTHHAIWLESDTTKVKRVYYQEPAKKVILDILYTSRHDDEKRFPKIIEVKMIGKDEKEKNLRLDIIKAEAQDKALDTEITIPQGYVRLQ